MSADIAMKLLNKKEVMLDEITTSLYELSTAVKTELSEYSLTSDLNLVRKKIKEEKDRINKMDFLKKIIKNEQIHLNLICTSLSSKNNESNLFLGWGAYDLSIDTNIKYINEQISTDIAKNIGIFDQVDLNYLIEFYTNNYIMFEKLMKSSLDLANNYNTQIDNNVIRCFFENSFKRYSFDGIYYNFDCSNIASTDYINFRYNEDPHHYIENEQKEDICDFMNSNKEDVAKRTGIVIPQLPSIYQDILIRSRVKNNIIK